MPSTGTQEERFPELFFQTSDDPYARKRTKEMKVLVIGMMRTGTKSMRQALYDLGYHDVYHMVSCIQNPNDSLMWREAIEAKYFGKGRKYTREDFDKLLGNCEACIDVPSAAFMPELIEAYPDAKVIISQRDFEKWYTSYYHTVGKRGKNWKLLTLSLLDPFFLGKWTPMVGAMTAGMFGEKGTSDKENMKQKYTALHDEARRIVPEDRLLEYHLGDGWEPLCKFLGKEVPKESFPFINETAEFGERIDIMEKKAFGRVVKSAVPIAGAMAFASAWYFGLFKH